MIWPGRARSASLAVPRDLPSERCSIARVRGPAMQRIDERTYVCTACNLIIHVESDDLPVAMISAHSGQPNMRVVTVAGATVHRCVIADKPRTIRMDRESPILHSDAVNRAAGMVSVQARCYVEDAFTSM